MKADQKKVIVEFSVGPESSSHPLVKGLLSEPGLNVDLRRARATARDSWFQFEVSGTAAAIDAFIRRRDELMVVYPDAA